MKITALLRATICLFILFTSITKINAQTYCTPPFSDCSSRTRISNVTFATINNTTACSASGYTNYTGTVAAPTVGAGGTYILSVSCDYGTYIPSNVAVWIDYNKNGSFEASEFVNLGSVSGPTQTILTAQVTIDPASVIGTTRMRVRAKTTDSGSGAFAYTSSCSDLGFNEYGETEDYTINIIAFPACTGTPAGGTTVSSSGGVCSGAAFTLSVNGSSSSLAGLTYQWESSPNGTTFTPVSGATQPALFLSQTTPAYYRRKITCNGGTFAYSSTLLVSMSPFNTCYCIPAGSNCGGFQYAGVQNVLFSNLNNASGCSATGYTDYTGSVAAANIQAGTYVPATIQFLSDNTISTKYVGVGIDFNHNGIFDYGEVAYGSSQTVAIMNIRIPFTAITGNTRMRVRSSYSSTQPGMCNDDTYSETEDYLVNITAPASPGPNFSFYVNPLATGNGYGTSWANAFTNLMTCLGVVNTGDTVRVAKATYTISGYPYYFSMKDSIVVLGGYPNSGNPGDALRNWSANQTILSGAGTTSIVQGTNGFTLDGFILQDINSYPNDGGAIRLNNSVGAKIRHCVFRNNYNPGTPGNGSAIKCTNSSPVISDCIFTNNKDEVGSAIFAQTNSNMTISNCVFANNNNNTSTVQGNLSTINIINCDFVSNKTGNNKTISGINNAVFNISNTIFFNNQKRILPSSNIDYSIDSSDIGLSSSTASLSNTITQAYNYGNLALLSKNPKFRDTSNITGPDNLYFTSDDGLQLVNPCSPAINAGLNSAVAGITTDILGNSRIFASLVDLGAYEVQSALLTVPHTLYVNRLATGNGSGTSWVNAMTDLQVALQSCSDTIRVAAGSYAPSGDLTDKSFWLENKRVLLGGYPNTGSPTDAQRNPSLNQTTLTGLLPVGGGSKSAIILRGRTVDSTSVTDGFFISNADGTYAIHRGAIFLSTLSNPLFRNCTISNNLSDGLGGGLYNINGSRPRFENSIFENNMLTNVSSGGAVANTGNSNAVFFKCTFRNNSTYISGTSPASGGAVYNANSNPVFDSCTFLKNIANDYGGAMDNVNSNPVISNCRFLGNKVTPAGSFGGNAIDINNDHSSPQIYNTVFYDSSGCNNGGSIVNLNQSNPTFTKCEFKNGYAFFYGGFIFNDNSSPAFSGCVFTGAKAYEGGGVIYNQNGSSPVVVNCLATGNVVVSVNTGSFMHTAAGNPVVKNSTITNNGRIIGPPTLYDAPVFVNDAATQLIISNCIIRDNVISATDIADAPGTATPTLMNNSISQQYGTTGVNGNLVGTDPLFINPQNPAGPDNAFYTADDGYRISPCSPTVNAGLNNAVTGYPTDIIGNPRVFNSTVDMGAYEVQSIPTLVTNTWTGSVNNTWENPLNWSLGIIPDGCTKVIINTGTVTLSSNAGIYSLTANTGANVTVAAGYHLTVTH